MPQISLKRAEKLAEVWPDAKSLSHACELAGLTTKDKRNQARHRRDAEELLGISLETINAKHATHHEIACPSTLDTKAARKAKDFVITSHTNDSPLLGDFLTTLEKFVKHRAKNGQLLVVPVRYRNRDAMHHTDPYKWDQRIYPYALNEDLHLNTKLMISAHRMRATTINPLAGKQALSGSKSAIYGHPQLAMELVGTPNDEVPKVMMTTGSCNRPKYSSSDVGGKANFYHTVYAVYVKVVRGGFHYTQLGWDGKGFCFGNEYWTVDGLTEPAVANIVHGDSHVAHEIAQISSSKLRIKDLVKPSIQVWHDLHDHNRGSHHETLRERSERMTAGKLLVEEEVRMSIDYLERLGQGTENWIVGANHNDHLDKWHLNFKPKEDPINIPFHGWLSSKMYNTPRHALETCFDEWGCGVDYKFLSRNSRANIEGIDVSQHGDKGTNGSRGGPKGFAKTMNKTVIAHSHTPCIEKGCWQVGTSTDKMTYSEGYCTWMLTDCLIYQNGKRALINHIGGKTIFDLC